MPYTGPNPLRQRLCLLPEDRPWSCYHATAGLATLAAFLRADLLLQTLGGAAPQRRSRELVASAPARAA